MSHSINLFGKRFWTIPDHLTPLYRGSGKGYAMIDKEDDEICHLSYGKKELIGSYYNPEFHEVIDVQFSCYEAIEL